jgi:predicted nucleotidyltransferase
LQSDIDIAVKGLSPEIYFQAIFELGELLPRQVEIIELENCRFADKIIETGLKII